MSNDALFACPIPGACVDGSNGTCADGYVGAYCTTCDSGYYRLGQLCEECQTSDSFSVVLIIALASCGVLLLTALALHRYISKYIVGSVGVKVIINFVQMLGTFATMTNVWTGNTKSVVNIASLGNINLQLARPECYDDTATYQTIWYARMALPCAIFLPALLILTFVKHFADNVVPRGTISRIFLIVMIFLFVSTSITTLELFDCSRRSDGTYIMDASPDIECFDGVWWEMFPVACAGILFYVLGVPLGTYKIWKKHGNFRPPEYRDDDKKRMYSWESVILLRKLLLIVLSLFLNDKPIAFFITASGVLGTALYFHVIYRPYKQARHNVMDSCMLVTLLGFVVSTLVLSEGNDKDVEIVIYWIDVSLFALTLLTFAYVWFADIRDAYSSNSTSSQEMSHQPTANQQGESKAAQKPEPSPPTGPAYMHYAAGSNEFDTSHTDEQTRTHRQSREMATFDDGHQSMALHYADDGVGTQPRLGTALENSV